MKIKLLFVIAALIVINVFSLVRFSDLKQKVIIHNSNENLINMGKIDIPAEELGYPYFFTIDSTLHIYNVFIPDKAQPNVTYKHLETISKIFQD